MKFSGKLGKKGPFKYQVELNSFDVDNIHFKEILDVGFYYKPFKWDYIINVWEIEGKDHIKLIGHIESVTETIWWDKE